MVNPELDRILQLVEKHRVTAYKIAQNTGLTEQGVGKILSKKTNPRRTTTKLILDFLNSLEIESVSKTNPRLGALQEIANLSSYSREQQKEEIRKIITRQSLLAEGEQIDLLINELLIEREKVAQLNDVMSQSAFDDFKEFIKDKLKR